MNKWTKRTQAVPVGTDPYDWSSGTIYECTWYAYFRVQEGSGLLQPPCWYNGSGDIGYGTYTNAKDWLDHWRTPWEVHSIYDEPDYKCLPGDIIVFTGTYGHVVVVEEVNPDGTLQVSDYNLIGGAHTFGFKNDYRYGDIIRGYMSTGACIGVLHNPNIESFNIADIIGIVKKKRRKLNKRRFTIDVKL